VAGSQTPGLNYGWPITEGDECFQADSCDDRLLVPPIVTYGHDEGCSITGGFVYEGDDIPALAGHYLYGDYCSGFVRSVVRFPLLNDRIGSSQHDLFPEGTVPNLTSFGRDGHGELYLLSRNGSVFKLVAP
jgi:glucose/arabinose dehydrogenase